MIKQCRYCGKKYDTQKESQIWCEKNPHRGKGKKTPKIIKIFCIDLISHKNDIRTQ
jgi:hypothetical protein